MTKDGILFFLFRLLPDRCVCIFENKKLFGRIELGDQSDTQGDFKQAMQLMISEKVKS
jgi:hypothetical protein